MRIGIFDFGSFFWTLAGTRSKEEGASGLALQVLRYMRDRAKKAELDVVLLAADGPPELSSRSWRLRVDPGYKAHRAPKDEEQRAELVALVRALEGADFTVVAAAENEAGSISEGLFWFEADDVAYSAAKKIASSSTESERFEAHVFSTDWDLTQILAPPPAWDSPELWENCVRLFTTRGEERTAASVEREFGVSPAKLAELKALAGDPSDGYKPFPGAEPGKPGIGEKTAAGILRAFGSAHSAMAAALSDLDSAFTQKHLPKRIPALLRKGGEAALGRGLKLATLRADVPIPDDFEEGDWEAAEAALLQRKVEEQQPEFEKLIAQHDANKVHSGASEGGVIGPADLTKHPGGADCQDPCRYCAAEREQRDAAKTAGGTLDDLGRVVEEWSAEDEAASEALKAAKEREARVIDRALARRKFVILTEAEFMAIAPLPAMWSACLLHPPADVEEAVSALVGALSAGMLKPTADRRAFIGELSEEAERGVAVLSGLAVAVKYGNVEVKDFADELAVLPRFVALADYGKALVRSA